MPLTTDELLDLTNAVDALMCAYCPADLEKLRAEYRPGTPGHARLLALLPRLLELAGPA
jgi:hypothetical protein